MSPLLSKKQFQAMFKDIYKGNVMDERYRAYVSYIQLAKKLAKEKSSKT